MIWFYCTASLLLGILIGRVYGWMKYHYPEFQEEIQVKIAQKRLERISIQADEERIRAQIDRSLDRRIRGIG